MKRLAGWMLMMVFTAALSGCSIDVNGSNNPPSAGEPGSKYRFSLPDLEGKTVALDGLLQNHKAVLLNFWATWCPFCIEEIPDLNKLQAEMAGKSFTVVGINVGESRDDAAAFAQRHPMNFPIVLDRDMAVSETYSVIGLPTSMLIRSDGKVLGVYHSYTPQLRADVEAALAA